MSKSSMGHPTITTPTKLAAQLSALTGRPVISTTRNAVAMTLAPTTAKTIFR